MDEEGMRRTIEENLRRSMEQDSTRRTIEQQQLNDPLILSNSDNPGAQLVTLKLSGTNFLNWSRRVRMALGAKSKLGFIDGSVQRPTLGSPEGARWVKVGFMVR